MSWLFVRHSAPWLVQHLTEKPGANLCNFHERHQLHHKFQSCGRIMWPHSHFCSIWRLKNKQTLPCDIEIVYMTGLRLGCRSMLWAVSETHAPVCPFPAVKRLTWTLDMKQKKLPLHWHSATATSFIELAASKFATVGDVRPLEKEKC